MKIVCVVLLLVFGIHHQRSVAQAALEAGVAAQGAAEAAGREEARRLLAKRRMDEAMNQTLTAKKIEVGGALVEIAAKSEQPKIHQLRQPANPKTDLRQVYYDVNTPSKPRGFVLLSLGF